MRWPTIKFSTSKFIDALVLLAAIVTFFMYFAA